MIKIKKGFSLIELLFSIAIISTVIVMVCIFYSYMMKVSTKGVDISIGTQLAEGKLNLISSGDWDSKPNIFSDTSFVEADYEKIGSINYYYLVRVSPISDSSNYDDMHLFIADVLVFWYAGDSVVSDSSTGGESSTSSSTASVSEKSASYLNDLKKVYQNTSLDYIPDSLIIDKLGSDKTLNVNEGYKFVRLSRIIFKG